MMALRLRPQHKTGIATLWITRLYGVLLRVVFAAFFLVAITSLYAILDPLGTPEQKAAGMILSWLTLAGLFLIGRYRTPEVPVDQLVNDV